MSKVVIVPVTGAQNLSAINDNFQTIADALNEQVLFRDNPPGEPNQIITSLDMNGKRIYNLPQPVSPSEPVRYQDLGDVTALTDAAREYAEAAEVSSQQSSLKAAESASSASSADISATNAANSATAASDASNAAQGFATDAQNSAIAAEEAASQADRVPQTSVTGAAVIPAGTELERPNPLPSTGLLVRGNTDTGKPEWYNRPLLAWKNLVDEDQLGVLDAKVQTLDTNLQALDAATGFTIIYPNGGSAASPANAATNSRYVSANPFGSAHVMCVVQILYNGIWADPGWDGDTGTSGHAIGARASHVTSATVNAIIVQTGASGLLSASNLTGGGHSLPTGTSVLTAPMRVKVWELKGSM